MRVFRQGLLATLLLLPLAAAGQSLSAFNVRDFGAQGDGRTDDSAAFAAAFAACYKAGGGRVTVPSSGAAYHLKTNLRLFQNACGLVGDGLPNWPGPAGPEAGWTASGSWVACDDRDPASACIDFSGSGFVERINFWHTHDTEPSATPGVAWTPTRYPWTIAFRQNFSHASDVMLANAPYGIAFEYRVGSNIGGTYSYLENIWGGCFNVCIRFHAVNDTMHVRNLHVRHLWHLGNDNLRDYLERNLIGWEVAYLDNLAGEGIEFYNTAIAILFRDASATYGTGTILHAAENVMLTNVGFNQVVQAMRVEDAKTNVSVSLSNFVGQTDTDTGRAAPYFFDLRSDMADVILSGGRISATGGALVGLGAGHGGRLQVNGLTVQSPYPNGAVSGYGYLQPGAPAFVLAKGALLDLPGGTARIVPASGAGPVIACAAPLAGRPSRSNCGAVLGVVPAAAPAAP